MDDPPPPPERELLEKYNLPAHQNAGISGPDVRATFSVQAFDRLTMLRIGEVWWHDNRFVLKTLMERLGSQQAGMQDEVDGNYFNLVQVNLTCTAPDESAATAIFEAINDFLQNPDGLTPDGLLRPVPWGEEAADARGTIQQNGRQLIFDLRFYAVHRGLPRLIEYLRSHGCTDIHYTLQETSWDGRHWTAET